jgi:regulator of protease activity HflC (stomatin/prohibitin superfamily)
VFRTLIVAQGQRVAWYVDGRFRQLLGLGRHTVWTLVGAHRFDWIDTSVSLKPLADTDPLPPDTEGQRVVTVGTHERVAIMVHGAFRGLLTPGRYRFWEEAGPLEELRVDVRDEPVALSESDPLPATGTGWGEATGSPATAVVLARHGQALRELPAARYRAWSGGPWSLKVVSLALQTLEIAAQDLLTRDQVPVRVKPGVAVRVTDALQVSREPDWTNQVYTAVQLALRDVVTGRELEVLLTDRGALGDELAASARARLPPVGVALESVVVKDITLPGEVKDLFNRVTLARKEAEALAIKRREEVAQTRQLANTARMLENNPVLLRLKELEGMAEIASKIERITLVGGGDLVKHVLLSEAVSGTR